MASTDATFVPVKNQAYRWTFVILEADADPVTSAAGLDSEVSKDGAAFADCTNEATEVAQGVYYLDLTATEMNADTVVVVVKSSTTGAKYAYLIVTPQEAGTELKVDVTHAAATAWASGAITAAAIATDAIDADALADNAITAATFAAGAINAAAIATDAIDADALAADAVTEIQAGLSTLDAAGIRTAVGLASANLDTQLATIHAFLDTEIAAILAAVDTEVGAIKTVTDQLVAAQAEPTAPPAANASPLAKIAWMGAMARNKRSTSSSQDILYADDGTTPIGTSAISDNGTVTTLGEYA